MKKIILILIILLAFGLRFYRINNPLADWHSWRQADTSAVSRNFIKLGFDIFHPRFDDLSNVASGLENPEGYRFVEFPFYNVLQAGFYKLMPAFSLEAWGRLVSIFASLGSLIFLYLIVKKYIDTKTALLTVFFFAVLPYNIYYSRVILPEPMMVFTSLMMIFFFDRWFESSRFLDALLAFLSAAVSFLLKPYTLVFLLPIIYLAWRKWQFNWRKWCSLSLCLFASLLPFVGWRWWMSHFPEGIPAYNWLFNEGGIRLKGAFFWWLFAERLGRLILGFWGLIFLGLGLAAQRTKKEGVFFLAWLGGILAYLVIIASGNVKHDYYQIIAIPIICVFLAKGFILLWRPTPAFNRFAGYFLSVVTLLFMLAFSWYQVRDFFNVNEPKIVKAGKAVNQLLPLEAKVIAPYGGDTAFLYQTNRRGWPVGIEIEKMINLGAEYYVNINFGPEVEWVVGSWCLLEKSDEWVIVDLTKRCEP